MAGFSFAKRIETLPPYLFAKIDEVKTKLRKEGIDIIDLSIGDPDMPTPESIVSALKSEASRPEHHKYPNYIGGPALRNAVSNWYGERFDVDIDPDREVVILIGSKEGIAHFPLAFINPGDIGLVPDPGYPVYSTCISFAGGEPRALALKKENGFKPDFSELSAEEKRRAKLLFFNYPNNPTSALADMPFYEKAVSFAQENEVILAHDAAYTEVILGGMEPLSLLNASGAKEVGIEFHSLSKTFNMTGWRVGFAVGNEKLIAGLKQVKTNVDSGVFGALQAASVHALENWKELRDPINAEYQKRSELVVEGLNRLGIKHTTPKATFYVWCDVPGKESSSDFCQRVLEKTGVTFTPGVGFGAHGEGYFRISLTASKVRLQEALRRLEEVL